MTKSVFIALAIGFVIEAALIALLFSDGLGPCGPTSMVGALVLIIHAPGLMLTDALRLRESASVVFVVTAYIALWGGIALLILAPRKRQ